ncbi:hypothetical protein JHW40_05045 [Paracoccus alcaliphilus]|nr:hypothetical protein JHW40_05045 [Paracoccus alcaliphilus]
MIGIDISKATPDVNAHPEGDDLCSHDLAPIFHLIATGSFWTLPAGSAQSGCFLRIRLDGRARSA